VVRLGQQVLHFPVTDPEFGLESSFAPRTGIQEADAKAAETPRDRRTDSSETDDANRGAVQIIAGEKVEAPLLPLTGPHQILSLGDATEAGEEKCQRRVGRGLGEDVGGVADRNPPNRAGGDVDVVHPYRQLGDHSQTRSGVQEFGIDPIDQHAENPVSLGHLPEEGRAVGGARSRKLITRTGRIERMHPFRQFPRHDVPRHHPTLGSFSRLFRDFTANLILVSLARFPADTRRNARWLTSTATAGVFLIACGSLPPAAPASSASTSTTARPTTTTTTTAIESASLLSTTTTVMTAESLPAGSFLVGQATTEIEIYDTPVATTPKEVLEATTILGSPRVFLVETGPVDGWVEVSLPIRPNGSTGWVRAGDLDLEVLDHAIVVDLSDRRLRLEKDGEVVLETPVAIGSSQNPTPTGSYFVTDVVELADPAGPWGPFALGLSAFSDTITEFNGGNGIIGIHGTNRPASIGEPVSLGCVRVPNEIATELAELVKLGAPVEIRA
jgi:lipoprotein-anchoring transpeptidase ErfK/SrfK